MNRKSIPTTHAEALEALKGRPSRTIANNTFLARLDDGIGLYLHRTCVVAFKADGSIVLNSGGYHTVTTKDRLNRVARAHGWNVFARAFDWYIEGPDGKAVEFVDGFTIPSPSREHRREDHCTHPEQDWCDCDWCRVLRSKSEPDFTVENHGTIFLVRAQNDAAREHLEENVEESAQWFGSALAVEHRCILNLVALLREEGFAVEGAA